MDKRALYRVHSQAVKPVGVIVHLDAAEHRLAVGDHFETEGEAWDWLERDVKAQGRLVACEIERLRKQLGAAEKEAGDALIRAKAIDDGRTRGDTHER